MKVLPIVAGTAALIAGTPTAYASPQPAVGCAVDVLSVPGCPPDALGCVPGAFPDDFLGFLETEDCDPGEFWEDRADAPPPTGLTVDPDIPARAEPNGAIPPVPARGDPPHRARARRVAGTTPGTTPSRPGGDPTSIVQRPLAARGTERDSVDNPGVGHGAMRGGLPHGLAPRGPVDRRRRSGAAPPGERPPVLPRIVPGPSGAASARSKLTTLAPTGPLRAGRKSWAAMVGAAVVAEAGLLWLVVGLTLRRRGRSRSKR